MAQQVETAQFLPPAVVGELTGELVCYARSVVNQEWPRMEAGVLGEQISPWGAELFRTLETVQPGTASEQAAYGKWLDQTATRELARIDRVHGARGPWSSSTSNCASPARANHLHAMRAGPRADAMSDQPGDGRASGPPRRDRAEILATLLLARAAVATAWSSYQATRWNGEQALAAGRTNASRIQAARGEPGRGGDPGRRGDLHPMDQRPGERNTALADFYRTRFRRAARPGRRGVVRLRRTNIQRATNYVLGVVLFAVALFFAGIVTKLRSPPLRRSLLVVGSVLFVGTVAWIATFPEGRPLRSGADPSPSSWRW